MNKRNGFTLIETLIVLALVALMFTFGTMKLNSFREASDEKHFWMQLERAWQQSQARAQNSGKPTAIKLSANKEQLLFHARDRNGNDDDNDIQIPKTIEVRAFKAITMHQNGYVKPQTAKFYSRRTNKMYLMKIQLAYGGYYIEKE